MNYKIEQLFIISTRRNYNILTTYMWSGIVIIGAIIIIIYLFIVIIILLSRFTKQVFISVVISKTYPHEVDKFLQVSVHTINQTLH